MEREVIGICSHVCPSFYFMAALPVRRCPCDLRTQRCAEQYGFPGKTASSEGPGQPGKSLPTPSSPGASSRPAFPRRSAVRP